MARKGAETSVCTMILGLSAQTANNPETLLQEADLSPSQTFLPATRDYRSDGASKNMRNISTCEIHTY